ncbi:MAG: ATP-dependent helicase [Deltaproteobacteria bacterium]|nr:ATP-dependent helicase [Deltaproteobacteria bacterium]
MSKPAELNEAQRKAVEHAGGPLLIIAGAGTGKTRVITYRIAHLIEEGTPPSEILALTFTDKAATEMEERVDKLVPYGYTDVNISTFHSFGDSVLRDNALDIGMVPDFKVLGIAETVIFLREHLFELPLDYYRPSGNPTRYLSALVKFIARLKDEDVTPKEYMDFAEGLSEEEFEATYIQKQRELALLYAKYQELMAENGYIDYGDQLTLPLKLFRERPHILKEYRESFSHILADEFQDTNYAQFELLKLLLDDERNITVVADDDQSIYKFRGAAVSNIMNFMDTYKDAVTVTLTKNYRSVQPILDAAYKLIEHNNPDRLEVKLKIDKKLISEREDTEKSGVLLHKHFDTLSSEAEFVAKTIEAKVAEEGLEYRDFAVLVRSNNSADPFMRALSERDIPYRFSGNRGLYECEEVRALIAFLKVLTDRQDSISLFHLASAEPYSLTADELIPCHNYAKRKHTSLMAVMEGVSDGKISAVELPEPSLAKVRRLVEDVRRYSEAALNEPTGRILYSFLKDTGYLADLAEEATLLAEVRVKNIAKFLSLVTHIEDTLSLKRAQRLVEELTLLMEAGDDPPMAEAEPDGDSVQVITVHKSKGLEFPVVFVVSLVAQRFPTNKKSELIKMPEEIIKDTLPTGNFHIEEERRLFYVAMTRAMTELYITSAADYGGKRVKKVSPFVEEVFGEVEPSIVKVSIDESLKRFSSEADTAETTPARVIDGETVLKLNFSQIDNYIYCPYKYRFVHILNVPTPPNYAMMYGSAMHAAVALYYEERMKGKSASEEEVLRTFKSAWSSDGFLSKAHATERFDYGVDTLKRFYAKEATLQTKPLSVEKSFSIELGRDIINGRWDLIEERADGVHIVDFKTSDVSDVDKALKKAKDSLQLKLYALCYRESFGELPAGCELNFLGTGLVGAVTFKDKQMDRTLEIVEGVSRGIRAGDFEAKPDFTNCGYCDFKDICKKKF